MKTKKTLTALFTALSFTAALAQTVNLEWAKQFGHWFGDQGLSIAVDASGNVYTTGSFVSTVDFDPGADTFYLINVGSSNDIFISKLNASGNFLWAKQFASSWWDVGYSIAVDASGNVYTTGGFSGTADFDPGADTFNMTSPGSADIFISKLDASGNFLWAKRMGGNWEARGYSIAVDDSGNVYTTGYFVKTADFDPGVGTFSMTAGDYDIFVSKLDSSGNFLWAKKLAGGGYEEGLSITVDESGNVYTTGRFWGIVDFNPGAGTFNMSSTGGSTDIFISKLDSSGNFLWAKQLGGTSIDWALSIALDASGNIYTTGSFEDTADFDPGAGTFNMTSAGSDDIFISKLDSSGNFLWAKQWGGASVDIGRSIALDASGNVYTSGSFRDTADFNPDTGTFNMISAGSNDIFISKLDSSGNFLWAKRFGDSDWNDYGYSIAVDASGNVYTTGTFEGTPDFDLGAGTFNMTSAGSTDIFLHKMSQCSPTSSTITLTACDSYTSPSTNYTWTVNGTHS